MAISILNSKKYQVILHLRDGRRFLVGYTTRKSHAGMMDAMKRVGSHIMALMPDLPADAQIIRESTGFDLGGGHSVKWGKSHKADPHSPLLFLGK